MNNVIEYIFNAASNNSILGISFDAIFTTCFTILIFFLGLVFQKKREKKKDLEKSYEYRNFLLHHLSSLLPSVDEQIKNYTTLSESIVSIGEKDYDLGEALSPEIILFDKIDFPRAYKVFVEIETSTSKEIFDNYHTILNSLNFFQKQIDYAKKNFLDFVESIRKFKNDWAESSNEIFRYYDKFISDLRKNQQDLEKDLFLDELAKIIHKWNVSENRDKVETFEQEFIQPLRDLCRRKISDSRSTILLGYLVSSSTAVRNILHTKKVYQKYFEEEAKNLESKKNKLIEVFFESINLTKDAKSINNNRILNNNNSI